MNPLDAFFKAFERERTRWPLWLPVALAVGVVSYFSLSSEPHGALVALPLGLGAAAWFLRLKHWRLAVVFFVFAVIGVGFSAAKIEAALDKRPMLDAPLPLQTVSGRLAAIDILPDGLRLTLLHPRLGSLMPEETPEKVRVKFNELVLDEAPPIGAEIEFTAQLGPLSEPVAPGATDFRRQAYYNHLGGVGWSRSRITVIDPAPQDYSTGETFDLALERARKTLARHVYARLDGDVAAITAAKMNGEQSAISGPAMEAMRTAGLIHLLATSGANVTIMGLLIYFPLRMLLALWPWFALRFPIKKIAAIAAVFSALAFTFLVGSQAATMRSMVMVAIAMLAILVDRHTNLLRLVLLSALLAMLFAPSATMGPSFQMSFAAVFCLVATAKNFGAFQQKSGGSLPPFFSGLWAIVRTSLIATAATTPFSIYHFQTFNVYGFIANTLAIPLTSFWIMPFTIMAYVTAPFEADGFFIDLAGAGNAAVLRIATTVAAWPYALFHWPAMPSYALVAIVLGGLWLCLWQKKWRIWGLLPIAIGLLYPLYTRTPDFFVSPNGKAWAAKLEDGRLAVSSSKREKFTISQWRQRLGNVDIIDAGILPPDHREIRCDPEGCVYRKNEQIVAMPLVASAAAEDCKRADIVVAPFVINECSASRVIDQNALHRHGAHALYFKNGHVEVSVSRPEKGQRPWSHGHAY